MASSTPVRVADDVAADAKSVAAREHRSTTEQINRWARIGRNVDLSTSVDQRRIMAVVAGDTQFKSLSPRERVLAHAIVDADIERLAADAHFGAEARDERGLTTVALDANGGLVLMAPDGTETPL